MPIQWPKLILSLLLPQLAGLFGALFTRAGVGEWYPLLQKPSFTPPAWIFAPVWVTLYLLMGVSLYRVWVRGASSSTRRRALLPFFLQLALNALWSLFFFGLRQPLYGLIDISALWLLIALTIFLFYRVDKPAAALLAPYFLWVSFASVLNFAIWRLNPY